VRGEPSDSGVAAPNARIETSESADSGSNALSASRERDGSSREITAPGVSPTTPERVAPLALPSSLAERWDDIIAATREVRPFLASALEKAEPTAVNARGEVTLTLEPPDEIAEQAIVAGADEVTKAIGLYFDGITRVRLATRRDTAEPAGAPRRYTAEEVRAERIAILRRRDPTLAAAIDALDLELIE
jgi:hypothetical protein